ncbi:hypothetical protein [Streptomyces fulvoviolaceus]|uniref:hypothetical protein n=1 Tax=Streptomyces fulvoviolaceus TaxID=285535 RepID=UPI00131AE263|nr:hypothetical protein [Streptomyces fulvoviolaceus]MCT9081635.1 hypothetical protein [Streptomyces fulvoviolaceus]
MWTPSAAVPTPGSARHYRPAGLNAEPRLGGTDSLRKPFLTAFAAHEDITRAFEQVFQEHIPGAKGWSHPTVSDTGHFLREQQLDLLFETVLGLGRQQLPTHPAPSTHPAPTQENPCLRDSGVCSTAGESPC